MTRRGGLFLPLLLIATGVVALLSREGLIALNFRHLWRLWPLVLILLGLELVLTRSRWGSVLFVVLALATVAGAVAYMATGPTEPSASRSEQQWLTQALEGAKEARVDIQFGPGELRLGALVDSPDLMTGEFSYDAEQYRLVKSYRVSGERGYLSLSNERRESPWRWGDGGSDTSWDIRLNAGVPLDLRLDLGVGKASLDLSRLQVTRLDLNTGVGDVEVTFPESSGRTTADVNVGVGDVNLEIPEGVAARIDVDRGLGEIQIAARFRQQDGFYLSEGYESATNRVDLEVKGGIGSLTIR